MSQNFFFFAKNQKKKTEHLRKVLYLKQKNIIINKIKMNYKR